MKFTEGAFRAWGYEVAKEEFSDVTITEDEVWDKFGGNIPEGKIVIKDRIADIMFQLLQLRPSEFDVIATTNLNGDYLSDAAGQRKSEESESHLVRTSRIMSLYLRQHTELLLNTRI